MERRAAVLLYCHRCGTLKPACEAVCPSCNGTDFDARVTRPTVPGKDPSPIELPEPWSVLGQWPAGSTVSLAGAPGTGKSSLGMLLVEAHRAAGLDACWFASEQTPKQVADVGRRVMGATRYPKAAPQVVPTSGPEDVEEMLPKLGAGLLVLDSLTHAATWDGQVAILELVDGWVSEGADRRALVVLQVNSKGEGAGALAIPHLVDACGDAWGDDWGLHRLGLWKNRHGPTDVAYYRLGAGGVEEPSFESAAWSVEGSPGRYELHPWPMPGARWAGVLDALFEGEAGPVLGIAAAGVSVPGYPDGIFEPLDVAARRRFAEAHGLRWWRD